MTGSAERRDFLDRLQRDVLILDGAMGTQLNERGIAFTESFELANLDRRDWVLDVHQRYLEAGAQGITTNTFGANRFRLARHRAEDRLVRILEAALDVAREAAGGSRYVIGSLGPLGVEIEPIGRLERGEARAAFREVAEILAPGVDAFALETFSNLGELLEALRGVREVSDRPIVAYLTVNGEGVTLRGTHALEGAVRLDEAGADAVGLNCSTGPRAVLQTMLRMAEVTRKPLAARPNAGIPREAEGRVFYENNPDYFARFARRFLQAGGRLLGGCCGTTPEHVRAMARAARAAGAQMRAERLATAPAVAVREARPLKPQSLLERSRLGRALAEGACPVSVELLPPRTPDMSRMSDAARRLKDAGATVINIPDGPRASARISNMAAAVILQRDLGVETLPHFCCRDRNLLGMQSDLMGAAALGIRNVLVITGDPPYVGNYPDVTAVFDVDAIGLCNMIDNLNHGLDLGGNELGQQTHLCFGAAFNHTALDLERELKRFHWKAEAGVSFVITQPVFDAGELLRVLDRLPGARPPLLAGIWPLRSLRNAEFLAAEVPGVSVPDAVVERMRAADARGTAGEEGVAIARETVEALAGHVQGFQIAAPFNRPEAAVAVMETAHEVGRRGPSAPSGGSRPAAAPPHSG